MELPDREICYRALQTRDSRFDGLLFVGVTSTGIYCRPVCPARTPKLEHCRFFASAAAAQEAGFRPCLRCRPETAPELASWRGTSNTVSRALTLIADGALDGDEASVEKLAERLGVGDRQLRRLFLRHLGASPVAVAQTRRVLLAKQLIHETRLSMTEIALAAGFGSVRRFNETFRELFRRPPSSLRHAISPSSASSQPGVTLCLRYRAPYDWDSMLKYLEARAIPGVELVENGTYQRTIDIDGSIGTVRVSHLPKRQSLSLTIRLARVQSIPAVVARVRRQFDLGADIETIGTHLSRDPLIAPLVALRPGLRAPGGWDPFEIAVRSILGQQVSLAAARYLAGQLVGRYGKPLAEGLSVHPQLTHLFPTPERLAYPDVIELGMPAARLRSLKALARSAFEDVDLFHPFKSIEQATARLRSIPGIGDWTAQYIALRALREMDAFPASDLGLLRGASTLDAGLSTPPELLRRAERWRPWRAYAAQHLWAMDACGARMAPETAA